MNRKEVEGSKGHSDCERQVELAEHGHCPAIRTMIDKYVQSAMWETDDRRLRLKTDDCDRRLTTATDD
jgi:hypothetical protein